MFKISKVLFDGSIGRFDRFEFLGSFSNNMTWILNDTIFILENGEVIEFIKSKKIIQCLPFGERFIFLEMMDNDLQRMIVDLESLQIRHLPSNIEIYSGGTNMCIAVNKDTITTVALSLDGFNLIWEKEGRHYFHQWKEFTFSRELYDLALMNNETGNEIWKFPSFSQFDYEVKDFIDEPPKKQKATFKGLFGVYNNIVWFNVAPGRILGLNFLNGELIYDIVEPNSYPKDHDPRFQKSRFFGNHSQFDEKQGMLFGLYKEEYWEIDLNNPIEGFKLYSFKESTEKFGLIADGNVIQPFTNDRIFFFSGYPKENAIGVFDRNKKEIIWAAPVEKTSSGFPAIRRMAYGNDRLFLVTDNGNLIVYERE